MEIILSITVGLLVAAMPLLMAQIKIVSGLAARLGGNTLRPAMKEQFGQFVIFVTSLRRCLMKALLPNDMGFLFGLSHGRSRRFAGQAVFALAGKRAAERHVRTGFAGDFVPVEPGADDVDRIGDLAVPRAVARHLAQTVGFIAGP